MTITAEILKAIAPHANVALVPFLNDTMAHYQINTLQRAAMFLAQTAHESDGFQTTHEYASGKAYEGRKDLGNTQAGDGMKYKGRGLIMVTGRFNYQKASDEFGIDFVNTPKMLEFPEYACKSAGWFWDKHKLNDIADKGQFAQVTQIVNGGQTGAASRHEYYNRAISALSNKG